MVKVKEMDRIIEFLKNNKTVTCNPYPQYDEPIMQALSLLPSDMNYSEHYEKIQDKEISKMSRSEIATMLTFIQRGERFCDGHIASFVESGTLLELVIRLRELETKRFPGFSGLKEALSGLFSKNRAGSERNNRR